MKATRHQIMVAITALITVIAIVAVVNPQASNVLDQLLPTLMLILGYYFGTKR